AAGVTTASFTVTALSDLILESPETVSLVLFGGNVGSSPSILTINDVVAPTGTTPTGTTTTPAPTATTPASTAVPNYFFSAANYSVNEGSTAPITINRSGNVTAASAILFRTGDGSAQATAADYASVTQGIFFAAGQTSVQVPVRALFDSLTEPTETVNLFLSGGSLASPSLAVLSIIDPTFVAPTVFFYGSSPDPIIDGGTGVVMINRTGNTSVSASVDYLIAGGPGVPLNTIDYTIDPLGNFTGGTVNFNPGQTSVSLTINNPLGFTGGSVGLGFGPGANVGTQGSNTITLL
ncbi:Calx-beta domain-containing protein, partial [Microcoleus sp. LAD1_D3]|uniref:Calx-beta domain-containing protein n=1 Tax=Microcoleus sp. LAD1_D3 TaxID=2819365 RepID=UPI002FD0252A